MVAHNQCIVVTFCLLIIFLWIIASLELCLQATGAGQRTQHIPRQVHGPLHAPTADGIQHALDNRGPRGRCCRCEGLAGGGKMLRPQGT